MPSVNTYLDDAVGQCIGQGQHGGVDQVVPFSGEVLMRPASCVNRRRVGLYGVIGKAASDALTMCHRFRCTRRKPPEHAKLIPSHSPSACWGTLNRYQGISTRESVTRGFVSSPLDQSSRYSIRFVTEGMALCTFIRWLHPPCLEHARRAVVARAGCRHHLQATR